MFSLSALTFLMPWVLAAAAVLPIIWWLLRVTPPSPKMVRLPTFFLLDGLKPDVKTTAHTPWWLLLLRTLVLLFFILGLADPVLRLAKGLPGNGMVIIAVDNGFAAAANWDLRQKKIDDVLQIAEREGRSVAIVPTSPAPTDGKINATGVLTAAAAREFIARLQPNPWPADYAKASESLQALSTAGHIYFISDGTLSNALDQREFIENIKAGAPTMSVVMDEKVNQPFLLRKTKIKGSEIVFDVDRLQSDAGDLALQAVSDEGVVLDEKVFSFAAGEKRASVSWDLLSDLRQRTARITLRGVRSASATYLTDAKWRQKAVGILSDTAQKENNSVLNEVYYLRRALEETGPVVVGDAETMLEQGVSVIVWPDSAPVPAGQRVALIDWVENGGMLVRFAGPNLAANPQDPLLAVDLRFGQRAMEGAMTWEKPLALSGIPEKTPFYGLDVPKDVRVTRQVLANPSPEVFEKTWLTLEDGTPLVTGTSKGKGTIVLVHTTAGPDWSNFCYSGLYVEMLSRMTLLAAGGGAIQADAKLAPVQVMDGFGALSGVDTKSVAGVVDSRAPFMPSPQSPPGVYGDGSQFAVFSVGDGVTELKKIQDLPAEAAIESYDLSGEESVKPDFFKVALLLLLVDTFLTLWLRGALPALRKNVSAVLVALLLLWPAQSFAEDVDVDRVSGVYFAYLETGDQDTDTVSYNGLTGLAGVVNMRTNIKVMGVAAVNPDIDNLHYYPFIYWPMTGNQTALSSTAERKIQNYLARGGLILFDTRDGQFGTTQGQTIGTEKLRQMTQGLRIPELMQVPEGHILTKSFYLLDDFPGTYATTKIWVEKEPNPANDSVTSVIIGGNDWAGAWSREVRDRSRFIVTPGGEQQREMAYRFGVNLAMAALAGNYKSDQVHVPFILERLGR